MKDIKSIKVLMVLGVVVITIWGAQAQNMNDSLCYTISNRGTGILFNYNKPSEKPYFTLPNTKFTTIKYSPDGEHIVLISDSSATLCQMNGEIVKEIINGPVLPSQVQFVGKSGFFFHTSFGTTTLYEENGEPIGVFLFEKGNDVKGVFASNSQNEYFITLENYRKEFKLVKVYFFFKDEVFYQDSEIMDINRNVAPVVLLDGKKHLLLSGTKSIIVNTKRMKVVKTFKEDSPQIIVASVSANKKNLVVQTDDYQISVLKVKGLEPICDSISNSGFFYDNIHFFNNGLYAWGDQFLSIYTFIDNKLELSSQNESYWLSQFLFHNPEYK